MMRYEEADEDKGGIRRKNEVLSMRDGIKYIRREHEA